MEITDYTGFEDKELVLLVKEKDQLAFSEIYRRYWHLLYVHAIKIINDEVEAKDLLQEVFFTFWERSASIDVKANLGGYLYSSVRNLIFSLIRKRKVNPDFVDLVIEEMEGMDNSTLEKINERELIKLIEIEIQQLPPKMKLVFELSRKQFLTNKEIAMHLNMKEEAVKKQIHRSIRILKMNLEKHIGISTFLLSFFHQKI